MLTSVEIKERLKSLDEITLLELLGLNSNDLVEAFDDIIQDKLEQLAKEVSFDYDDEDD